MKAIRKIQKGLFCLVSSLLFLVSFSARAQTTQKFLYAEPYRPQFHFSPEKNWMNDPNGLVYYKGEYHLFYQYNPFGNTWGHMSWGHAVSRDLVHWQYLPVALEEENGVMIFSGAAVVDNDNTSGFGTAENPPMVAIYTGHDENRKVQDQRIAYSLDKGRTWAKYKGNPVIDEGMQDFRDPKVFWHNATQKWVMALVLPKQHKVRFYGSTNLKDWKQLSEFGPSGSREGIWECPGIFKLPVDGNPDQTKWVLQVDINPGAPAGGSGSQYFIGTFDGERFVQDPSTEGETLWSDYGKDFYAVQSFSNIPEEDGRRIWIAWMNNWQYGQQIPTHPWRSAMTIPRSLRLQTFDDGIKLVQQPVSEFKRLRAKRYHFENLTIKGDSDTLQKAGVKGKMLEVKARFKTVHASSFGLKVAKGGGEQTIIGYETGNNQMYVDRRQSGDTRFSDDFPGIHRAPLPAEDGEVVVHFFLDTSSVEVFGNGGRVTLTEQIFPSPNSEGIGLFSDGGSTRLISLDIWQLSSIWNTKKD
ncbi:MAG: glycoside hydrolase family 32 protein [Balneolaceae bacterium]|jgi:fructan beta-fructosidase